MNSLNRAMILGNVTRDPEGRTTPDGTPVTSFGVATNFRWTDAQGQRQERAEFHNIVAWRKLAEICAQYIKKGSKIYVEGRIQTRSWEDQQGQKKYRTEIVADNVILLDRPSSSSNANDAGRTPPEPQASEPQPPVAEPVINVEEIPF